MDALVLERIKKYGTSHLVIQFSTGPRPGVWKERRTFVFGTSIPSQIAHPAMTRRGCFGVGIEVDTDIIV
jgi:hypothetical protein